MTTKRKDQALRSTNNNQGPSTDKVSMKLVIILSSLLIYSCSSNFVDSIPRAPSSENVIGLYQDEPLYGMELTFTSEELKDAGRSAGGNTINTKANKQAQKELIQEILKVCDGCTVSWTSDKNGLRSGRITYPDSHYFDITLDPWVVEVIGKPIPQSKLKKLTKRMQTDIFDPARRIGLQPGFGAGGGHIHFGIKGLFENDANLLRDFLVDSYNHSELGSGILNYDHANSPTLDALPEASKRAFWDIIDNFDYWPTSLLELSNDILKRVHKKTVKLWAPPQKYHGINLMRLKKKVPVNDRTIELRFIRPQQSGEQFRLITTLITNRVRYLRRQRTAGVIPALNINHPQTVEEKFKHFMTYITESDLDPIHYLRILPAEYGELSWQYIQQNKPEDIGMKWVFLQEFALDSPYDDSAKAQFILNKLKELDSIGPRHESIMATLIERSHESPSKPIIDEMINGPLWKATEVNKSYRKILKSKKSFTKNCRDFLKEILMPYPRAN